MSHRSVTRSIALGVAVFFSSLAVLASAQVPGSATGAVTVSLETEALSISIAGGDIVFDKGPYGSRSLIYADQRPDSDAPAPVITNDGNVIIGSLIVEYDSPQASCGGGTSSWAAGPIAEVSTDVFAMRAGIDSVMSTTKQADKDIDPLTGSGDLLTTSPHSLPPDMAFPLLLMLVTPDPATTGGEGCTIGLTVTAAAS